jgi:UDP:flavonoid glycosyltransferase YjiC (YdhE family)
VRVLFTCVVGVGHFNPMVPLAKAFEAAGHEVAFATDPGFVGHVRGLGFEAFPAGLDMPVARRLFAESMPGFRDLPPTDHMTYLMPGLFGGVRIEPMLADLDRILPQWRPDLLIHDSAEMAGAIAAEGLGIAHVEHSFGVLRPTDVRRRATDAIAPVAERRGVPNPGVGGFTGELGSRPLVYVTMGTEFNKELGVFRAILDGLGGEPFEVVVTVGPSGDPDALRPYADNIRVQRFIPQSALLPRAAVFVSHAGSGATLGALRAGVPMLAIPQGADQFLNAGRVVDTSVGLRLMPNEVSADAVGDAVRALLDDYRYRDAARVHQASIEALPSPDAIVPILTAVARG